MTNSIQHINSVVQGAWIRFEKDDPIEHLLTDSRKLLFPDATLFFALDGPRRNGSGFVADLYQKGVRNFIVPADFKPSAEWPQANIIGVPDVLDALQAVAAEHRSRFDIPVIGITGSNGKTVVKEWLNQLLEDQFNIVRSPRSFNSQIGVPLSVWPMNEQHQLGIFEAGISKRREMQQLEKIIRPGIGIFTNIGEAHDEGFQNLAQKINEKLELFQHSKTIIYCADQEPVRHALSSWITQHPGTELFSWGKQPGATVRIASVAKMPTHTLVAISYREKSFSVRIDFLDDAAIENALTCIATMLYLELAPETFQSRLNRLSPLSMRLELKTGIHHCSIINDSYSNDMSSFRVALDFLAQQRQHRDHVVIMSDILESGRDERSLYQEVASLLSRNQVSRLIAIGKKIMAHRDLFDQTFRTPPEFYDTTEAFLETLPDQAFHDQAILIKGARIFGFEKIDGSLSLQVHQTVLEISLDAMTNNLRQYQQLLRPTTKVMAMVKAFSYGTGSYEIARHLEFNKVDYLAVAYVDEGVELRRSGIRLPIMVMNTEEDSLGALLEYRLEPVLFSFGLLNALSQFLKKEAAFDYPVHIELETGMNRLGFALENIELLTERIAAPEFHIQSVYTHLAASEEPQQDAFTAKQAELFANAVGRMRQKISYAFFLHIANSAAIVRSPHLQLDMVRLGIGLYGVDSSDSHRLALQQVGTLKSTIAQIKLLHENDTVGYNRKGVVKNNVRMATVRIGYADGYPRVLGNGVGKMLLRGKLVPTIGSICMDMTMIDISELPEAMEGDEVIVFGNGLPVEQLARWAGTIPYEILTGISQRVKRVYFE